MGAFFVIIHCYLQTMLNMNINFGGNQTKGEKRKTKKGYAVYIKYNTSVNRSGTDT